MIWARIFGAVPGWAKAALAGVLGACLVFGAGYVVGSREARQAAALGAAQDNINTRNRVDEAMDNPDGCAWHDRIMRTCDQ